MTQFYAALLLTIIHSLWQAAVLTIVSRIVCSIKGFSPTNAQRFISIQLFLQVVLSVLTFNYIFDPRAGASLFGTINSFLVGWAPLLCQLYFAVLFIRVVDLLLGWHRFRRLCFLDMKKPPIDLRLFMQSAANNLGIKRNISLWLSDSVTGILTFGFFRPVIVLPTALLNHLTIKEAESLIIHELAHIRSNDFVRNIFLLAIETLYFFNPFIRTLCHDLRLEREKNCDMRVLDHKYDPVCYAETLFKAAQFQTQISVFAMTASGTDKQLENRIRYFAKYGTKKRKRFLPAFVLMLTVMLSALVLRFEPLTPSPEDAQTTKQNPPAGQLENQPQVPVSVSSTPGSATPVSLIMFHEDLAEAKQPVTRKKTSPMIGHDVPQQESIESSKVVDPFIHSVVNSERNIKEVVVIEEESGETDVVTKTFSIEFKDGEWKEELLYLMRERKSTNDSCRVIDSTQARPLEMQ